MTPKMTEFSSADSPSSSHRHPRKSVVAWSLRPVWRAVALLAVVLALGGGLTYRTVQIALASAPVDSISIPAVKAGLAHDRGNSTLSHHLGLLYSSSPTDMDLAEAHKYLGEAVAMEPRRWDYWADLASSCDSMGDTPGADNAYEKSHALNPSTPQLLWMVGNHYVLTDRLDKGFPYFRQLLENQPQYLGPTFRLCLRAAGDPERVFAEVVPQGKDPTLRFAFLGFVSASGDTASAMRLWSRMINGPDRSVSVTSAKLFLDFLIDHNQIQDALTVWKDLTRAGLVPPEGVGNSDNLMYNGGFERLPLNLGFDWRYDERDDLLFDFADATALQGRRCLRIEFPVGRNEEYNLVRQIVPVTPNTRYQLTAMARSESLTSDSGPRFRVVFLGCGNCAVPTTDETLGTTRWHPVEVSFTTPPETHAVAVSLWRPLGRLAPRDLSGTFWVGHVSLGEVRAAKAAVAAGRSR